MNICITEAVFLFIFLTLIAAEENYKASEGNTYTFTTHPNRKIACSSKHYEKLKTHRNHSICQPRETIIPIHTGKTGFMFEPNHLVVKRCIGVCKSQLSCIPVKEKIVKTQFNVQQNNLLDSTSKCGTVDVDEHQECKCSCTVMEENCNKEIQEYDSSNCRCKCKMDMTKDCEIMDKLWDPNECKCYCKNNNERNNCSSMEYWHPEMCMCVKMHHANDNSALQR